MFKWCYSCCCQFFIGTVRVFSKPKKKMVSVVGEEPPPPYIFLLSLKESELLCSPKNLTAAAVKVQILDIFWERRRDTFLKLFFSGHPPISRENPDGTWWWYKQFCLYQCITETHLFQDYGDVTLSSMQKPRRLMVFFNPSSGKRCAIKETKTNSMF